jgi:GT2 family glycosyltransferase
MSDWTQPAQSESDPTATSYVIVLNWNGWKDTIECLESVLRLNGPNIRVIVCDNASSDGSFEKLKEWARGNREPTIRNPELSHLITPQVAKPISYLELTTREAESATRFDSAPLVFIQTGANLGYAGGNNVGLRYALRDARAQYFWLLNNDTVVEPDALTAMIQFMQQNRRAGLCGSLNLSYFEPGEILSRGGGAYNRWTGRVSKIKGPAGKASRLAPERIDFITGASVLVTRDFLNKVGLMEESYFLYFEEHDWAARAKGKFQLGYARESIIYHKEGMAIGSHRNRENRSLLSEKYLSRNRLLFTRRFFPWALPSVIVAVTATAAYWLVRGKVQRAWVILRSMFEGLQKTTGTANTAMIH